ncbi:leucine-rich repeat-containing protein 14 isoform X2 [Opisthocomus hoazin]|uniref:leucine-rich repeat-containing protein 14 isoform X2 n=1 Tax=Opisthocomus hoazin TaxID=30419 RepID=UPI003F52F253
MHSLAFLCARRLVSHRPDLRRALALLPAELYPVLFRAAFLDGRVPALRALVGTWPFPVLSFRRLVGHRRSSLLAAEAANPCVQAVLLAVVAQLRRAPDEPARHASARRCCLRVLDMTGLQDADHGLEWKSLWSGTVALAKACLEISKHRTRRPNRGSARPNAAPAAPPPFGVEIRADLFVNATSFGVLRDALRAAGPLRLKCRDFHAEELSAAGTVDLLESLEPAGVRRVDLRFNNLGLPGLCAVLPHLARFPDLLSLKLPYSNVDVRRAPADAGLGQLAAQLGRLPGLKELDLGSSRLSGKLRQLLGDLRAPLESLELAFCRLLPGDLAFLCQSLHAPALRKLDLSGHDFSEENLSQPLRRLLARSSASLRHLDLMECRLTDAGLEVLLPAVRRCARLRCLGLFGNPLTTPGLQTLLQETAALPDLRLVVYPYPVDCYSRERPRPPCDDAVDEERFAAASAELRRMLVSAGRADVVWTTSLCRHGAPDCFDL